MFEVVETIGEATNGFEEMGSGFEGLDTGRVEDECAVAVGDGVGSAAGGTISGGAVEETLGEEGLRGGAATFKDLSEEADRLGGEASVESGEGSSSAAEEELYVAEEGGSGVCFGGCGRKHRKTRE